MAQMEGVRNAVAAPEVLPFGALLRQHRLAAGLAQETLAERADISVDTVSALERGTRLRPYQATIALLADALELSPKDRNQFENAARRNPAPSRRAARAQSVRAARNVPVPLSTFIGRETEVQKVQTLLTSYRLITLVGAGGVGKTRLALYAVTGLGESDSTEAQFDDVWFVDFAPLADGSKVATAIASTVGLERCTSMNALVAYLKGQRFLLILDNCEHLIDATARAAEAILRHCPNARVLATSRQALGLDGERVYRVPPLSCPRYDAGTLSVSEALEYEAIKLFVDRAEAVDSGFVLTESLLPAVIDICRRLDGIALAIELAAARTHTFPPADIARQISAHLLHFSANNRSALPRHKTMYAVLDWSYDLLDDRERKAFRMLSTFSGFTLELAVELCAGIMEERDVFDTLASLVDKSLIQTDALAEPLRFYLLSPTREYAREKLWEYDEYDSAMCSHALAMLAFAEEFDSRLLSLMPGAIFDAHIDSESENFRAAFEWALGSDGDGNLALRLAGSTTATLSALYSGELRDWISAALALSGETTPPNVRAKLYAISARAAAFLGSGPREALAAAELSLKHQQPDDLPGVATAQYQVGRALLNAGRLEESETMLRKAIANARASGAQYPWAYATKALGNARLRAGDLEAARELVSEVLQRELAVGCDRGTFDA